VNVQMLGSHETLHWKQESQALKIKKPLAAASDIGVTFKVTLA
jgi:hypothetical protein